MLLTGYSNILLKKVLQDQNLKQLTFLSYFSSKILMGSPGEISNIKTIFLNSIPYSFISKKKYLTHKNIN